MTSLLDLGRVEEGEELAQPLFAAFSDSTAVQALERRLRAFHAPRLDGYFSRARSSAANVVSGELSYAYGIEITSAPIDYRSRVFAAVDRRTSTFADAVLRHTRSAVGYRYRHGGLGIHFAITDSQGDIDDTGYRAGVELSAGDHASFGIDYESVSLETPLRAGLTGATADRLDLAAAYRWHESRFLRLNLGRMDFTDGNRRDYGGINWEERWVAGPVYRLYSFLGAYRSSNSLQGVDYFNPTRDRTLGLTVRNRWNTWRRYERAFHQVLDLSVGRYDQQGFVVGDTWGMRYEHTFEREDEYLLSYGVRRSRDFYDGKPEYVNEIFLRYSRIF